MIAITLHRGGYPTLVSELAATMLRDGRRGSMSPSDYKAILLDEWDLAGRGGGYSSGNVYAQDTEYGTVRVLFEVFSNEIGAWILSVPEGGDAEKVLAEVKDY